MEEVAHVPARQRAVFRDLAHTVLVALPKQLHANYGEDEHDDGQHQCQVAQSPDGVTNNFDQGVECGPGLGQFEDSQLKAGETSYRCRFACLLLLFNVWTMCLPVGTFGGQTCPRSTELAPSNLT